MIAFFQKLIRRLVLDYPVNRFHQITLNPRSGLEKWALIEYHQYENVFNLISENYSDIFIKLLKISENKLNQ